MATWPAPKPQKPERGTAEAKRYLDLVAQTVCVICGCDPVERHHPIHGRFAQRKSSDLDVIGLCSEHHRELHAGPERWREKYGEDHSYIPKVREAVDDIKSRTI